MANRIPFSTLIRRVRTINPEAADWLRDEFRKPEVFSRAFGVQCNTRKQVDEQLKLCSIVRGVISLFYWHQTPQGNPFWSEVQRQYEEKYLTLK